MARKARPGRTSRTTSRPALPPRLSPRVIALVGAALIALIVVAYWPVVHFGFVPLDDWLYVKDNPHVTAGLAWPGVVWAFTSRWASYWIPLTWISYMAEVRLFGVAPSVMHVTNVALHAANAVFLFIWLYQATSRAARSAFVAAAFAVHPLHVESVAWITERKDVLSTCALLLALLAYTAWARRGGAYRYLLVCVWLVVGLLAKPMLVTLPILFLLCDAWPLGRARLAADSAGRDVGWRRLLLEKVPFAVLALAGAVVVFITQNRGGAMITTTVFPLGLRIENAIVSCVQYLIQTVWPAGLIVLYPYPLSIPVWEVVASLAALTIVTYAVARIVRSRPYLAMGWFWYLIALVPVLGFVQVGLQPRADRFTYVPLIGISIAVVWGIADLVRHEMARRAVAAVGVALVLGWMVLAREQVEVWRDGVTLWTHAIDVIPPGLDAAQAQYELAAALMGQGRVDDAIPHYQEAVRDKPDYSGAYGALGMALAQRGRTAEAMADYETALRLDATIPEVQNDLGVLFANQGRMAEALPHFAAAVQYDPALESARVNYGVALMRTGRRDDAIREFTAALAIDPANAQAKHLLEVLKRP